MRWRLHRGNAITDASTDNESDAGPAISVSLRQLPEGTECYLLESPDGWRVAISPTLTGYGTALPSKRMRRNMVRDHQNGATEET